MRFGAIPPYKEQSEMANLIHHATAAKAEKQGIVLQVLKSISDESEVVKAIWPKRNKQLVAVNGKIALALMMLQQRFGDDYANLEVRNNGMASVVARTTEGDTELLTFDADDFEEDAIFADALEALMDAGIEAAEFEEGSSGNIVPAKYRAKYAAEGHPNHCGDWLAELLIEECTSEDSGGKSFFDIAAFDAIYDENKGLRTHKWCRNTSGRGWQGRYRMSGRIALAKVVGINGYLVLHGKRVTPPTEWLVKFAPKPAKAKGKVEQKQAA
jgi:hypothetical protein